MAKTLTRLLMPAALITAVWFVVPASSVAQIPLPILSPSPTPTPTPTSSPTHSPTPHPKPKPKPSPEDDAGAIPQRKPAKVPEAQVRKGIAKWLARAKSSARTTTRLLDLLSDLDTTGGALSVDDMRRGFGRFPVLGYVWYQDDFGAPRYVPSYHPHSGTDLFALEGTPIIATTDGRIMKMVNGPVSGNAIWLRGAGARAYFFYGHLSAFAPGMAKGRVVRRGEVLGFVGRTGDAINTPSHVHFEIHPTGSPDHPVNPKPYLDAWLRAAEDRALGILGFTRSGSARAGIPAWASFLGSIGSIEGEPALWTAALGGPAMYPVVDVALESMLAATEDVVPQGADAVAYPFPPYDPTRALAPLLAPAHVLAVD